MKKKLDAFGWLHIMLHMMRSSFIPRNMPTNTKKFVIDQDSLLKLVYQMN